MLRADANLEMIHDMVRRRIDNGNAVRLAVGNVDPRQRIGDRGTEPPCRSLAVQIARINHGRHAGHGVDRRSARATPPRDIPADDLGLDFGWGEHPVELFPPNRRRSDEPG
jgi:hypothetical protein